MQNMAIGSKYNIEMYDQMRGGRIILISEYITCTRAIFLLEKGKITCSRPSYLQIERYSACICGIEREYHQMCCMHDRETDIQVSHIFDSSLLHG
jgi:hypothetical protein